MGSVALEGGQMRSVINAEVDGENWKPGEVAGSLPRIGREAHPSGQLEFHPS